MPSRSRLLCCATLVLAFGGIAAAARSQEERPRARRPSRGATSRPQATAEEAAAQAGDEPAAGDRRPQQGPRPADEGDAAPAAVRGPFEPLTPEQQAELDDVLARWEERSARVKKFKAEFTRWEYNQAFGKRNAEGQLLPGRPGEGRMRYFAPDQGEYEIIGDEAGEHWVCDGKSIYFYDAPQQQLVESILPPGLQGRRITDGPLPFLFGADAERHKRRYWLRIVTPPEEVKQGRIWIQGFPRFQADYANFHQATMILTAEDMLPYAMETVLPNGDWTVHQFTNVTVNSIWQGPFKRPKLPAGWTHVRHDPPADVEVAPDAERQEARPAGNPPPRRASRPRREG